MKYNIAVVISTVGCPAPTTIRGFLRSEHLFEDNREAIEVLRSSLIENLAQPALKQGLTLYTHDADPIVDGKAGGVTKYLPSTMVIPRAILNLSAVTFQIVEAA